MFPPFASRMALRRRALPSGSPPPVRAATVISLMNLVNSLPRLASSAPFLCLILCHLECPDIGIYFLFDLMQWVVRRRNITQSDTDFSVCPIVLFNDVGQTQLRIPNHHLLNSTTLSANNLNSTLGHVESSGKQ